MLLVWYMVAIKITVDTKKEIEDLSHPSLHMTYIVMLAFNFSSLPLVVQFRTVKCSVPVAARRLTKRLSVSSY